MIDNVKSVFSVSVRRLLRPLVKIMLREGITYPHFSAIARMAFAESAAKDFGPVGAKSPASTICALTGMSSHELTSALDEHDRDETRETLTIGSPFASVLHGWYNDRDYVGPYGFPMDLPFTEGRLNFTALTARYAPRVSAQIVIQELIRLEAVKEVGENIWKPLKQECLDPSLTPENLRRMASLVESLLSTLENNTRNDNDGKLLFERTMYVGVPLTNVQLRALHEYLKVVGGQFMQRVDAFASVDLQEQVQVQPGDIAEVRAGLQSFLYVESKLDSVRIRDVIDFN